MKATTILKEGEDITVDQVLLNLNVSEETYLVAIRSNFSNNIFDTTTK